MDCAKMGFVSLFYSSAVLQYDFEAYIKDFMFMSLFVSGSEHE
jgi:hypothetical protein